MMTRLIFIIIMLISLSLPITATAPDETEGEVSDKPSSGEIAAVAIISTIIITETTHALVQHMINNDIILSKTERQEKRRLRREKRLNRRLVDPSMTNAAAGNNSITNNTNENNSADTTNQHSLCHDITNHSIITQFIPAAENTRMRRPVILAQPSFYAIGDAYFAAGEFDKARPFYLYAIKIGEPNADLARMKLERRSEFNMSAQDIDRAAASAPYPFDIIKPQHWKIIENND